MGGAYLIDKKKCNHQKFNEDCYLCRLITRIEIKDYIGLKRDWPLTWLHYDDDDLKKVG